MNKTLPVVALALFFGFTALGQTNITDSIVHQNYQRKFTVHTPTGFTNSKPVPIVMMLHGGGGTMTNAQSFTNLNRVSNTNGFLTVYPEGYGLISSGGFSWADGRGTSADIAGIDDLGFIDKLLDTLIDNYRIDTNKMYICGFSNGGFMTQRFACQQNKRFAAMASLGSIMDTNLFTNCKPQRNIPMLLMLGTADPFVPYNGGPMIGSGPVTPIVGMDSLINFWKHNNNCTTSNTPINFPDIDPTDSSTVTLFEYTNCSCNANISFYKINGGGHTWPGVEIPSYEVIAGQTNEDIQASEELWNFLSAHTLCAKTVGIEEPPTQETIDIYPNPATNILNIRTSASELRKIEIKNQLGQSILTPSKQIHIDISSLPSGLYFITFELEEKIRVLKFIKQVQ